VREGLAYARRIGNRQQEWNFLGQAYSPFALGEWDETIAMFRQIPEDSLLFDARQALQTVAVAGIPIEIHRGRIEEAERLLELCRVMEGSDDVQEHATYRYGYALVLMAYGRSADALAAAEEALAVREFLGTAQEVVKEAFVTSVEAALELDDVDKAEELVGVFEGLPRGRLPDYLVAQAARFRAALAARRGDADEAERRFKSSIGRFREIATRFWVAVAELEYAEWLQAEGRDDDAAALLAEAREIFEALGATPWLDRAAAASEEAMAGGVS
jgi:tetratricopeptide (TPR) repeat protein